MAFLYADFYEKKYKVPLCSCITLVMAFAFLLALALPWIVAYQTKSKV